MRVTPIRALVLTLSLVACRPLQAPELRIGINPWPGYEFLYLAKERGLFDTGVVRVRLLEFTSLSDARRAYERGQLDGFTSTVIEVLQARDRSIRQPVISLVTDFSDGADVVIARREVRDTRALRGRRVGAELGSLNVYLLERALALDGASLSDVTVVPVTLLRMVDAYRQGEVDAVATYPPASLDVLRIPGAHTIFSSHQIPGEVVDVVSLDSAVIGAHHAAVAGLIAGFERARRFAASHPDTAFATMAAREGVSPKEFQAALTDGIRLVDLDQQAGYLRPGGMVDSVGRRAAAVLVRTRQLVQPPELEGLSWNAGADLARHAFGASP